MTEEPRSQKVSFTMRLRNWQKGILAFLVACCFGLLFIELQAAPPVPPQPVLAKSVLLESGIAAQYDRYLMNGVEMAASPTMGPKFLTWLQQIVVREAGWKQVESQYAANLESNFSQAELQELESFLKQPLLKKLLQVDAKTYAEVSSNRRTALFKVWENYNQGMYSDAPIDGK